MPVCVHTGWLWTGAAVHDAFVGSSVCVWVGGVGVWCWERDHRGLRLESACVCSGG